MPTWKLAEAQCDLLAPEACRREGDLSWEGSCPLSSLSSHSGSVVIGWANMGSEDQKSQLLGLRVGKRRKTQVIRRER